MATVRHAFESEKSDGGDATLVRPSDWNADHVIDGDVPYGFIGASVSRTTNQSIADLTWTAVSFTDADTIDTDSFHNPSSNADRVIIPPGLGGNYLLIARYNFASHATSARYMRFTKNGAQITGNMSTSAVAGGDATAFSASHVLALNGGDYVGFDVHQNSGGALNVTAYFMVFKLDAGRVGSGVGASASASGTQSISHATDTALALDAADTFDTDGFHDPASNNTRMTIPTGLGGKYLVIGGTGYPANGTGVRVLFFKKNGTTAGQVRIFVATAAAFHSPQLSEILDLAAGDYIELWTSQDSGGSLNAGSGTGTTLQIMRLDSQPASYVAATEALLSSTTALGTTAYGDDLMSLTLPAGTYRVDWKVAISVGGNHVSIFGVLWDNAEAVKYDEDEATIGNASAGWRFSGLQGWATITLTTTTTIKVSASRSSDATASALKDGGNSTSGRLSKLSAQRLK